MSKALRYLKRCLFGDQASSYSPFTGYFYFINAIVGAAYLNVPYVFSSSGIIAATLTLFFISMISCCTAIWIVEAQSRAQALENLKLSSRKSLNEFDRHLQPDLELTTARKFEPTEMCQIFYHKGLKWVYIILLIVYGFIGSWAFATVAASAWASNIPFNTATLKKCTQEDFTGFWPEDPGCANSYRLCVFIFGVIVVALSLIELTEQKFIQVAVGVMRFVTMGSMMLFCIVRLIESGGLPPSFVLHNGINGTNGTNGTEVTCPVSSNVTLGESFSQFNFNSWLVGIPVFVYAQEMQSFTVTLVAPIKPKKSLRYFFPFLTTSTFLIYSVLAIPVAMYFQYCTQETASLNWLPWLEIDGYVALKVLSYCIILFPSLDAISVYPLVNTATVHNVYIILAGKDSTGDKRKYAKLVLFVLKFVCAVLPLSLAFAVSNLLHVVQYAGLLGFGISYLFPALLQFGSQYHCTKVFGDFPSTSVNDDESPPLSDALVHKKKNLKLSILKSWWLTWKNPAYWTPYSSFISHPISAAAICVICFILFALSVGSLFVPLQS